MNKRLTKVEIDFIQKNCINMKDEEIATALNRSIRAIVRCRKNLGVLKGQRGRLVSVDEPNEKKKEKKDLFGSQRLTENQRKEFFIAQTANSTYYEILKSQLTKEEIDFFLEEVGELSLQFEDVIASEKRQIFEFIKAEILGNRILSSIKITEEEIKKMQEEVDKLRFSGDIKNDIDLQERDLELMNMIRAMSSQSSAISNDYQKNIDTRNRLLENLNARRRDRIDSLRKGTTSFAGLVQIFRDRNTKEIQGRHTELMRIAREKKKSEFRKPIRYEDGKFDCILLDEFSEVSEKEAIRFSDMGSKILQDFREKIDKKILLVEDDIRRIQFFQDQFLHNKITYAKNSEEAIKELDGENFDCILLDYDIGLGGKGSEVAKYLIDNSYKESTSILVHSMNKKGAIEIQEVLKDRFKTLEIFPFEDLVRVTQGASDATTDTTK